MGLDTSVILFCICVSVTNYVSGVSLCDDTTFCPSHKPYCTEAGCVFRCPEDSYVNGSHCVLDCGAMFIDQSGKCIDQCEGGYIRESVRVKGTDIIKDKECLRKCTTPEYVFKNECVQACPVDQPYIDTVNENDHLSTTSYCAESCPPNKQYKTNFTINGLSYIKCTNVCGVLVQNEYCTTKCENGYVKLSKTCLKTCPETHPVLYSSTMTCFKECTNGTFNVECACPTSRPFVENQTCVFNCSEASPYKIQTRAITMCVSTCKPWQYVNNSYCVDNCPLNTFVNDKTCKEQCPKGTLSFNKTSIWSSTLNGICRPSITKLCVHECPGGTYQMENKCVYGCDKGLFLKNTTCVDSCYPEEFRKTRVVSFKTASIPFCKYPDTFNTEYVECVDECDKDNFAFNGTCVSSCPADYVVEHDSCVETCSDNRVLVNISLMVNGCKSSCPVNVYKQYFQCQEKCPSGQFPINKTCVFVCPSNLLAFQGSCVESCPPTNPYKQTLSVEYTIWQRLFYGFTSYTEHADTTACVTKCNERPYTFYNNASQRCVQQCPADYVVDHDSCVETCSNNGVLVNISLTVNGCKSSCPTSVYRQYIQCQEKCPSGQLLINKTCVFVCPTNLFAFQGSCVESCPPTNAYKQTFSVEFERWQRSQNARFASYTEHMDMSACVTNCSEPYVYDNVTEICVLKCPGQRPYASRLHSVEGMRICVSNCTRQYIYKSEYCVDLCPKDMPFVQNGHCVSSCPTFVSEGTCVDNCPKTATNIYNYFRHNYCVNECPSGHVLDRDNNKCISTFECSVFLYNRTCVNECPSDQPFNLGDYHRTCVKDCAANNKIQNGTLNTCITYRDCEGGSGGVIFDEKCLSECSDGYLCYYSITEGQYSCMKRYIPIVVCTVFLLIWTFVVVYGAGSMRAYIFVIGLSLSKDKREELFAEKRAPRSIEVMENDYSFECTDEDALL